MNTQLPNPLVPADVDLRDFRFTPMYRARLFGSEFHARTNDAEWRAGVTLWLKSQDQKPAGSLPDDDTQLCRLAELGRDVETWKKLRAGALHGWVRCRDGRLYHPVVAEIMLEQWDGKVQQRQRTLKARIAALEKRLSQAGESATKSDIEEQLQRLRQELSQLLSQKERCTVNGHVTESPTESVTEPVTASKGQGTEGTGTGTGNKKEAAAASLDAARARTDAAPSPGTTTQPAAAAAVGPKVDAVQPKGTSTAEPPFVPPEASDPPIDQNLGYRQRVRAADAWPRVAEAWGIDPARFTGNYTSLDTWLARGYDLEADILPAIRMVIARGAPIRQLSYFGRAIAEWNENRRKGELDDEQRQAAEVQGLEDTDLDKPTDPTFRRLPRWVLRRIRPARGLTMAMARSTLANFQKLKPGTLDEEREERALALVAVGLWPAADAVKIFPRIRDWPGMDLAALEAIANRIARGEDLSREDGP